MTSPHRPRPPVSTARSLSLIAASWGCLSCFSSLSAGCAGIITGAAADAVSGAGSTYAADDDPDLVRQALPFGLKTLEALLEKSPDDPKLLLAAAAGFTQYAYAFVQQDAEKLELDPAPGATEAARRELARARRLYARARAYGLRALAARHAGFGERFARDRAAAVAPLEREDVPILYWTAAAWAAEIAISKQDLTLVADLPAMEALMDRALALDEAFDHGAIHEFYVSYDGGRAEAAGGSVARAREHFARAMQLNGGEKVGPLVTLAEVIAVQAQDRQEFDALLDRALAFDADMAPRFRLVNLVAQERARRLRARASDLFLE